MARVRIDENFNKKKLEIVKSAFTILFEEGSEKLSVNYLLRKINMSKGAFFHYFASKEALLDSVLDYATEPVFRNMETVLANKSLGVVDKFTTLFHTTGSLKADYGKGLIALSEILYLNRNKLFLTKFMEKTFIKCLPIIEQIILDGQKSGDFKVRNAHGVAFHILNMTMRVNQEIGIFLLSDRSVDSQKKLIEKISVCETIIRTILNCKSLAKLYQPETLKRIGVL